MILAMVWNITGQKKKKMLPFVKDKEGKYQNLERWNVGILMKW